MTTTPGPATDLLARVAFAALPAFGLAAATSGCGGGPTRSSEGGEELVLEHLHDIRTGCSAMAMTMEPDARGRPYLYVAAKDGGLRIYEMGGDPELVRTIDGEALGSLDVMNLSQRGDHLYLALGDHFSNDQHPGMAVVDVGSPPAATVTDLWIDDQVQGAAGIVEVDGNFAYLGAMRDGLVILDVSDVSEVRKVSEILPDLTFPEEDPDESKYNARGLAVRDDRVYLAFDAGGLRIIDVTDRSEPREVGAYSNPVLNGKPRAYNNVALAGPYAYVTVDYCGLEVLDVSAPSSIRQVAWWNPWTCETDPRNWFDSDGHTNELALDRGDGLLFLSTGKSELRVVDVTAPADPSPVAEFGDTDNELGTWGVATGDRRVYLSYICTLGIPFASRWGGVKVLSYSFRPTSP